MRVSKSYYMKIIKTQKQIINKNQRVVTMGFTYIKTLDKTYFTIYI